MLSYGVIKANSGRMNSFDKCTITGNKCPIILFCIQFHCNIILFPMDCSMGILLNVCPVAQYC